ncbi:peroxiredoxin family protein [Candidatus Omnitrophota bacterium]
MKQNSITAFLCVLCICLLIGNALAMMPFSQLIINKEAPEFTLSDLRGNEVSLSEWKGKKPIILFFWTTWCPNCRSGIRTLNTEYSKIQSNGVELLAIDLGEKQSRVQEYVDRYSVSYPIFLDENEDVSSQYHIIGVPTYVLINKQGIVIETKHEFPADYKEKFTEQSE